MALNDQEQEYLEAVIDHFTEDPRPCNDWERGFMQDQCERFEEYGNDTRFSPKQWNIIFKIGDLYGLDRPQ